MQQKLDINEAARISGMSVSWWRQKVFRKQVPFYRVGRRIVFDAEDIAKVLDRCRVDPSIHSCQVSSPSILHNPRPRFMIVR
jgi:hypothetical protein